MSKKESILKMKLAELLNNKTDVEEKSVDLAIVGIDCCIGGKESLTDFWEGLRNGEDFVNEIDFERKNLVMKMAKDMGISSDLEFEEMSYLKNIHKFDHHFFDMTRKEASFLDPSQKLLLKSVYKCLEDSNQLIDSYYGSSTGVFVGYDDSDLLGYRDVLYRNSAEMYRMAIAGNHSSVLAGRISDYFDFSGPAYVINTACSSSMSAFHLACQSIIAGECEQAIIGTVNYCLFPVKMDEMKIGIESSNSRTRAFNYLSDGTGKGEGVVTLLLKKKEVAIRDRDNIYAIVKKTLTGHDGKASSLTSPNEKAQEDLQKKCWSSSNVDLHDLVYLECHGTGTKIGDPIEVSAINKALGRELKGKRVSLGSLKSNIGHLNCAAGLASIAKACCMIQNREIVPSIHYTFPNWNIDFLDTPFYVSKSRQKIEKNHFLVGINSFGLSGTNCHAILSNDESVNSQCIPVDEPSQYLLVVSAESATSLRNLCLKYFEYLFNVPENELIHVCYTAAVSRKHRGYRAAFSGKTIGEIQKKIIAFTQNDEHDLPDIYVDENEIRGALIAKEKSEYVDKIGFVYMNGQDIDWELGYDFQQYRKVHIPTYCFDEVDCWYDFDVDQKDYCYYQETWKEMKFGKAKVLDDQNYVVFYSKDQQTLQMLQILKNRVLKGKECKAICIDDSLENELEKLSLHAGEPISLVYLNLGQAEENDINKNVDLSLISIQKIYQFFVKRKHTNDRFIVIGKNGVKREYTTLVNAYVGASYEFVLGLAKEANNMKVKCIDIEDQNDLDSVFECVNRDSEENMIMLSKGKKYRKCYEEIIPTEKRELIENGDTILVVGGFSENALHLCSNMAQHHKLHFVLTSRQCEKHLKIGQIRCMIDRLKAYGSKIEWFDCDVSDENQVVELANKLSQKQINISGIIHCAGIETKGILAYKDENMIRNVIGPKVYGVSHIHTYFGDQSCKFLVLFSSLASVTRSIGQTDYAYANRFMDLYVNNLSDAFGKCISICWPGFKNAGMAKRNQVDFDSMITKPFSYKDIYTCFDQILLYFDKNVIVVNSDFQVEMDPEKPEKATEETQIIPKEYAEVQGEIKSIWKHILGVKEVSLFDSFYSCGGNSISIINLVSRLEKIFGVRINVSKDLGEMNIVENAKMICKLLDIQTIPEMKKETVCVSEDDKRIGKIIPFNQFLFINCYYNSLFTVFDHYHLPIHKILMKTSVEAMKKDNALSIAYRFVEDEKKMLHDLGLASEPIGDCRLDRRIRVAIDRKHFIILDVDCYYLSVRKEFYQKQHYNHTLLVYGYTQDMKNIIVMEQKNAESLSYQEKIIPYEELERAYHALKQNDYPNHSIEIWLQEQKDVFQENKEERNYVDVCEQSHRLLQEMLDQNEFDDQMTLKSLNHLIQYFTIEQYILKKNPRIEAYLEELTKLRVGFVRGRMDSERCLDQLLKLLAKERKLHRYQVM